MIRSVSGLVGMLIVAVVLTACPAVGQDTGPVPWKLGFDIEKLGFVTVSPRPGHADTYWYVVYKVTNNSGEERPLAPHFRVTTDTGKTYFEVVQPKAERMVERRLGRELVGATERLATIQDGESMAGVAFFGKFDPALDRITIAVTGIMDVVYRIGGKRYFKKDAMIFEWKRPGDEYYVDRDRLKLVKKYWKTIEGPKEIG